MKLQEAIQANSRLPVRLISNRKIYSPGTLFGKEEYSAMEVLSEWELVQPSKIFWLCTDLKRKAAIAPDDRNILNSLENFKDKKVKVTVEEIE